MKKVLSLLILMSVLCLGLASAGSGSIWTTKDDCGNESQDINHYEIGDKVYINGANFGDETSYAWDITGGEGGSSCDSGAIVASGNQATDAEGNICFEAYTVANDDCGEYKVNFGGKNDNYRVDGPPAQVPEFGTTVGILTTLGALGAFFLVRRK